MKKLLKIHPLKVFLCHSHADRDAVHALYKRLKRDHMEPWLDRESLLPGQNWEHEIHRAILKSDVVLVCLSNAFNEKHGFRHEELKIALKKTGMLSVDDIFIIPVRLEKCEMPDSLIHLHRVDLFEKDGYKRLILSLKKTD
ncbi:MAG: toll/interleukin-1 receptor domain-containing protein [Anaerolineales bacterium]|nr:toll/interleukin-1 receptor domain-containing protein [Anaerolineales bacterium]